MKPVINNVDIRSVNQFADAIKTGYPNDLDDYQTLATKSAIYPGQGTPFGLMYAALGLAEAGEVQNKVKKAFRDDGVIAFRERSASDEPWFEVQFSSITPERRQQIIKELGGLLWYVAATCNEINASISEVAVANLKELASRSERGTLAGDGDNR